MFNFDQYLHRTERLSIVQANFTDCQCVTDRQVWARPLELHKTGVAAGLRAGWRPQDHARNTLSNLGPHSVPLFLIKGRRGSHIVVRLTAQAKGKVKGRQGKALKVTINKS